jgi:hypothetical protein
MDQEFNEPDCYSKFNVNELTKSCIYIIQFLTSDMAKKKLDLLIIIQEFLHNSAYLIIDHFKDSKKYLFVNFKLNYLFGSFNKVIDNLFPYIMNGDQEVIFVINYYNI